MPKQSPICVICDEKITASKQTECPYCAFNPCRTCVRKYVLNESEPKCMNCKKVWTRAHQNTILLPSFVNNELRTHQEKVFYDREMALFPATIEVIEDRRTVEKLNYELRIISEKISAMIANMRYLKTVKRENRRRIDLNQTQPKMYSDVNVVELTQQNNIYSEKHRLEHDEYLQTQNKLRFISTLIRMAPEERRVVMANYIEGADPMEILETLRRTGQIREATRRARTQFIRACPIESCRGFLSQQWKCGICNVYTCNKCNVPKCNIPKTTESDAEPDEHVCNPDDVATAELLAKDTKPCPQCGMGIFKIEGCDQMWCTECRTAFNWRTGQLETGHVHNPHYFEYQRRMGTDVRNILDMPCGALAPDQYHGIIQHLINIAVNPTSCSNSDREQLGIPPITKDLRAKLRERAIDYAVSIDNFANRILPRYRPDAIQNNLELRVQYLTERITKDEFTAALSRESKQFNKKIEIGQVIQTVVFGMSDILTRFIGILRENYNRTENTNFCDHTKLFAIYAEIDALIDYANECLEFICKQYKLTRVAMFARDLSKKHYDGLFTVRTREEDTPEGKRKFLYQVKMM